MKITKTEIDGLLILEPDVYGDKRGYFFEAYNKKRFEKHGLNFEFVQDNFSRSVKGTVRGLHYQVGEFAQEKLCEALYGKVLDVAVDIRFGSPTFGKYVAVELSEDNHKQFWIPKGFAHGFSVLSDFAIFHYKVTNYYNKESERGIIYNDKTLAIDWKVEKPILSEKDLKAKSFNEIEKDFVYQKGAQ